MEQLRGKKLLILGGSPEEIALVERAKALGIYTIVADYYDSETSPAKKYADEVWNNSWTDINELAKKCRESEVNGVTAGYSEFRVKNLIKLCLILGLPCYINEDQFDITHNKGKFKKICQKNGVPVVKEYAYIDEVTKFPVIVKPVDRGGSIGISVANNQEELQKAYVYAMEMSVCKQVIIEDFITDGEKFDLYYAVLCGEPLLLTTSDTIHAAENGTEKVVQSGWLYPSKHLQAYMKNVEPSIKKMINDMEIIDGYIFFSGFALPNNEFVFFETGFRLSGEHIHAYAVKKGFVNVQDIFIKHALTGNTIGLDKGYDSFPELKCVIINYYSKSGTIATISGSSEIEKLKDNIFACYYANPGKKCDDSKAILPKISMFMFSNNSAEELSNDVKIANSVFTVTSIEGNDMVYNHFDESVINNWWK